MLDAKCKLTKTRTWLGFIDSCIERGICTQHLRKRLQHARLRASPENCERFLLSERSQLVEKVEILTSRVAALLPVIDTLSFVDFCRFTKLCRATVDKTKKTESKTTEGLLSAHCPTRQGEDQDKHIVNLSSYQLSTVEKQALRWGLDFCIPPKEVQRIPVRAQFEEVFLQVADVLPADTDIPRLKNELVHISNSYTRTPIEKGGLHPIHLKALRELKENPNLLVLRPDKGSGVVLLDRNAYVSKMEEVLQQDGKFSLDPKQKDSTTAVHSRLVKILNDLLRQHCIDDKLKSHLLSSGSATPRLYGLPKVHKDGEPLRPILSMIGSPTHLTSKWLANLLKPVKEALCDFCVDDSFNFVDKIKLRDISNNKMVSFDVKSLFTNIPVRETIDIIIDCIKDFDINIGLPLDALRGLLALCTQNVQFLFDGHFYVQKDGCAMGSPLGPIFADIFMGDCGRKLKQEIVSSCSLYTRYVDDCFLLLNPGVCESQLLQKFNAVHPSLTFTCEKEICDCLSFLDVKMKRRRDGSVQTAVFRKSTWTGLYTSFFSFVPKSYKIGLMKSLVHRSVRICSSDTLLDELHLLRRVFLDNGYPMFFIDKYLVPPQQRLPLYGPEKKPVFVNLPFIGDRASTYVKQSLRSLLKCAPVKPFVTFATSRVPVASPKDKLTASAQCKVIYQFVCSCGCKYIGRTARSLGDRAKEHIPKWLLDGKDAPPRAKTLPESAIARHLLTNGCDRTAARDRFKAIFRSASKRLLCVIEALAIKARTPDLCVQKEHVFTLALPW